MDALDCVTTLDQTIDTVCTGSTTSMGISSDRATDILPSSGSSTNAPKEAAPGVTSIENEHSKEASTEIATAATPTASQLPTKEEEESPIAHASDLSRLDRTIWVVTTAALPWRTGTSVNPLARALYLTRGRPKHAVTLLVPFLPSKEEQAQVFKDKSFDSEEEQEEWIRKYCMERVNCKGENNSIP